MFSDVLQGRTPPVQFTINGATYNMKYYLANDIYPNWTTLVKTIPMPEEEKRKLFAKMSRSDKKGCEENIWCA